MRSAPPPGANGTRMRTGRAWARAGAASDAARPPIMARRVIVTASSVAFLCPPTLHFFPVRRFHVGERMARAQLRRDCGDVVAVAVEHDDLRVRDARGVALHGL